MRCSSQRSLHFSVSLRPAWLTKTGKPNPFLLPTPQVLAPLPFPTHCFPSSPQSGCAHHSVTEQKWLRWSRQEKTPPGLFQRGTAPTRSGNAPALSQSASWGRLMVMDLLPCGCNLPPVAPTEFPRGCLHPVHGNGKTFAFLSWASPRKALGRWSLCWGGTGSRNQFAASDVNR